MTYARSGSDSSLTAKHYPWFRCFPMELMSTLSGLSPDQQVMLFWIMLRVYESNGPTRDDARTLARRSGLLPRRAEEALEHLIATNKVVSKNGTLLLTNALEELSRREIKSELARKSVAAREAKKANKNNKTNVSNDDREINYTESDTDTEADSIRNRRRKNLLSESKLQENGFYD